MNPFKLLHSLWLTLAAWTILLVGFSSQGQVTTTVIIPVTVPAPSPSQTPSSPPSQAPMASSQYTSDTEFRDTVLAVTNDYRAQHDAKPLTWNDTLAAYAQEWADRCVWKHSHGPYGENLAGGYPNASAAVAAWADERRMYDFRKPTGYTEATGHFTQLVWKATRQMGCARVDCGYDPEEDDDNSDRAKGWYVVCEYDPPGNVVGYNNRFFKENVEPQGGKGGSDSNNGDDDDDDNWYNKNGVASSVGRMSIWSVVVAVAVIFVLCV